MIVSLSDPVCPTIALGYRFTTNLDGLKSLKQLPAATFHRENETVWRLFYLASIPGTGGEHVQEKKHQTHHPRHAAFR